MTYNVGYVAAVILFIINAGIAVIQAAYAAGHGADLGITPQMQAWLAVVSAMIAAALSFLPQLQRTPAARRANYHKAMAGILPDDLAPKVMTLPTEKKPFDTIDT